MSSPNGNERLLPAALARLTSMKRLPLLLLSLAIAARLGATAQAPDILKIGDRTLLVTSNPLEPFLAANPGRLPEAEVMSTGLWRGYIATWSVRDGRLFVDDVRVPTKAYMDSDAPESKQFRSVLKPLFGDDVPHVATWFTGHLIVPTGEMVESTCTWATPPRMRPILS